MANLERAMAAFLARNAEDDARRPQWVRTNDALMTRIDQCLTRIEALLAEQDRMLKELPDILAQVIRTELLKRGAMT
jgi:hypothetical protein